MSHILYKWPAEKQQIINTQGIFTYKMELFSG